MVIAIALTESFNELSFRVLFDAAVDAMLLVDESGQVVLANPAACQLFGYSKKVLCGLQVEMLIPSRYRKHHRFFCQSFFSRPMQRSMGDGKGLTALTSDGKELLVDIGLSPIKVQQCLYALVTFNVADQRIKTEGALQASEERFYLAKQAAGLGVFDYDFRSKIIHWDEQMRQLWGGYSDETITYDEFIARIHPQDRAARQAAIERAVDPTGDGEYRAQYRIINPASGHEQWIRSVGRVHFKDGHASRLVGIARDVTTQKNHKKRLQAQRAETENLVKQQIAVHTASAIAHEINQPLAAISAYSEVALQTLQKNALDISKLTKALKGCVAQAQRAGNSLHELLAFLQKSEVAAEKIYLDEIVKEALNTIQNDGYGGFRQVLHWQPNLPAVQGNRIQIQKILVNLLKNAVESMQAAGVSDPVISVTVSALTDMKMVLIIVQDNGPGLDKLRAQRIFEPFFTTKPAGIGMGLAISRALAEANGGQLWLDPAARPGAKFHFTLPFAS